MYNRERSEELLNQDLSKDAIAELVKLNEGLVHSQLKSFGLYGDDDAISYAFEGLFKAVCTFDNSTGNKFSSYAIVCIRNSIQQLLRKRLAESKIVLVSLDSIVLDNVTLGETIPSTHVENNSDKIMDVVYNTAAAYTNTRVKGILMEWIESDFTATNIQLATQHGVSQPYVNNIINEFRAKLRIKLKGVV